MKTLAIILTLIVLTYGGWYYVPKLIPLACASTPFLCVYDRGVVHGRATAIDIIENPIANPVKGVDAATGEVTLGPSLMYSIDVKIRPISIIGLSRRFIVDDQIIIHEGWVGTKPNFQVGDIIEIGVDLIGSRPQYDPANATWRLQDNQQLWER